MRRSLAWAALLVVGCGGGEGGSNDSSTPDAQRPDGGPEVDGGPRPRAEIVVCPRTLTPPASGTCAVRTPGTAGLMLQGTVLAPGQVFENGQLLIGADGLIKCAACDCSVAAGAAAATLVDCAEAVISPGLINAHDHITFTNTPPHPPQTLRYNHRHEWRRTCPNDPDTELMTLGTANGRQVSWGELRNLLAGTTSIIGSGDAAGLIRNLDRSAARQEGLNQPPANFETFPLGDGTACTRPPTGCGYPKVPTASSISADAYVPHVSEGVNGAARNEFLCLSTEGGGAHDVVTTKSALVHSIGLTAADIGSIQSSGAMVVWSPRSNVDLYGNTAQVTMIHRMGVPIAIGTDWVASGSLNLLRELACASSLNAGYYDNYFTPEDLWTMATLNSARAAKMDDVIGSLRAGLQADVAVFRTRAGARRHFSAVVEAGDEDVALVLRGGRVMSGDADLVSALDGAAACDSLDVCGVMKRVCLMREISMNLTQLTSAVGTIEPLFYCGTPTNEPTCKPARPSEYTGDASAADPDGDGIGATDNCPRIFNPVRPMDAGKQADGDDDGIGDVCDPCPLDAQSSTCTVVSPDDIDRDGKPAAMDNCPTVANPDQADRDSDQIGDLCDLCPDMSNLGGATCTITIRAIRDPAGGRPYLNQRVSIAMGVVLSVRNIGFYMKDPVGRDYSGIWVHTMSAPMAGGTPIQPGMIVSLSGQLVSFLGSVDQLQSIQNLTIVSPTGGDTTPIDISTVELTYDSESGEKLESLLVRVRNVTVMRQATNDDDFYVTDTPATQDCAGGAPACARVSDFQIDGGSRNMMPASTIGQTFTSIVGVVDGVKNTQSLTPRTTGDMITP